MKLLFVLLLLLLVLSTIIIIIIIFFLSFYFIYFLKCCLRYLRIPYETLFATTSVCSLANSFVKNRFLVPMIKRTEIFRLITTTHFLICQQGSRVWQKEKLFSFENPRKSLISTKTEKKSQQMNLHRRSEQMLIRNI